MARYVSQYKCVNLDEDMLEVVGQFLIAEGYKCREYEYETVYQRGIGLFITPTFVKIRVDDNLLTMDVWTKDAMSAGVLFGERAPKKVPKILAETDTLLTRKGYKCLSQEKTDAAGEKALPAVTGLCSQWRFARRFGSRSFACEMRNMAVVLYLYAALSLVVAVSAKNWFVLGLFVAAAVAMVTAQVTKHPAILGATAAMSCAAGGVYYGLTFMGIKAYTYNGNPQVLVVTLAGCIVGTLWLLTAASGFIIAHKMRGYFMQFLSSKTDKREKEQETEKV